jgi:hypothetical protein
LIEYSKYHACVRLDSERETSSRFATQHLFVDNWLTFFQDKTSEVKELSVEVVDRPTKIQALPTAGGGEAAIQKKIAQKKKVRRDHFLIA